MLHCEGDEMALGAGSVDGLRYQENIAMCTTHQLTMGLVNASKKQGKGVEKRMLAVLNRAVMEREAIGDQLRSSLSST